jgi:hypothetical protein
MKVTSQVLREVGTVAAPTRNAEGLKAPLPPTSRDSTWHSRERGPTLRTKRKASGKAVWRQAPRRGISPVAQAVSRVFVFSMQTQQSIVVIQKAPGGVDSPHGLILFDAICGYARAAAVS